MGKQTVDVVTFGESMGSVRIQGTLSRPVSVSLTVAGAEGNVSVGLARLGHAVAWCGTLGQDGFGDHIFRTYRGEGVNMEWFSREAGVPTGLLISYDIGAGLRSVDYHRKSSAGGYVHVERVKEALDTGAQILHVTGITPAISEQAREAVFEAVEYARSQNITVSFDLNYRQQLLSRDEAKELFSDLVGLSDIVFGGMDEFKLLAPQAGFNEIVEVLLGKGVSEVVLKKGADGAETVTAAGRVKSAPKKVPVIDTVGAGDAFVAGYLSGYVSGFEIQQRLDRGNLLGGVVVSTHGDWEGLPTLENLSLFDIKPGEVVR